ncbi:cbb3-type cytochrome c oxidase subunit 3 [Tianweitania sediminis]|uniref:Cbb3-type cytochrome c oxidase subunit 3 n=2 Tax=Tianweitania sediminis TaxID=1502156 RepID=A0A8J7UJB1_9HYPH|nr:cbb3-type cytochrome c oxidase subunit 3 [Tianweitania sediminis]MBP0437167.1 cbb3-type cytochrome c oxidase subunit 3 [Tianweitania sediminis]HEV7417247.1 cbb3-type cytochrome c oxidase subunit 3 [Tianweitania sediminis]
MNLYETLRHFADSWALLVLVLFFLGVLIWVFRPGSRRSYRDQANIPFKYDREKEGRKDE